MVSLINEIQQGCIDDKVSIDSLLRRVKLAAVKLRLGDLEGWIDSELNGYVGDVPNHRIIRGELAGLDPHSGWLPVKINNVEMVDLLTKAHVRQSIAGLHDLIANTGGTGSYDFPISAKVLRLSKINAVRLVIQIPRGGIVGVLSFVRNMVLDWSIEMERNGVIGDGMSFSSKEIESAKDAMVTFKIGYIKNFNGNMGFGNTSGDINASKS